MLLVFVVAAVLCVASLTEGCGTRTVRTRVVGGVNASPHSWPWQISLRVNGRHICGGSLFKSNWVITAAHCVDRNSNPSGYTVVVGAHTRTGTTAVQQSLRVKKIIKHAGFSMRNLRNDIALLELERPATLSDKVNLAGDELLEADLQPTHYNKRCSQSCHTASVIKGTPAWYQLMRGAWYVPEVEQLIKLEVSKATVVARSCAKKAANGCCVVQLAGAIRCAALIITRSSLASAVSLTGFLKTWLVAVVLVLQAVWTSTYTANTGLDTALGTVTHPSINFTMELEENGRLPFLGMDIIRNGCHLDTKVYRKPTDTGLLLHYHSHVDVRYKRSLLNTMLNRAFKLSSSWKLFHQECERLEVTFSRLCYPEELVQSTIRQFIESKVSEGAPTQQNDLEKQDPIRIVLPFKDQKSANSVRRQLGDLSRKIKVDISPVYTSRKIKDEIKVREDKPPLVNQQCVVYNFQCNLCDAGYVGYTCRHLHQHIEEHKGSAIGKHLKEQQDMAPDDIAQFFRILKKCQSKFDCLIYEMFFIKELKPTLNKQCDSIRAKLFV
ncbi:hypothetical protein ACROYT_G037197 [Oculina patagonica]